MTTRIVHRSRPWSLGNVWAGLLLTLNVFGQAQEPKPADSLTYKFVNKTNGKFTDDQCFWSLSGGREWQSFAKESTVRCPGGNGRLYFRLGAVPKNFDDRETYWDFIEYDYNKGTC